MRQAEIKYRRALPHDFLAANKHAQQLVYFKNCCEQPFAGKNRTKLYTAVVYVS
jgi:hypothetical protein